MRVTRVTAIPSCVSILCGRYGLHQNFRQLVPRSGEILLRSIWFVLNDNHLTWIWLPLSLLLSDVLVPGCTLKLITAAIITLFLQYSF
jgi:hypothetical protein